MKRRMHIAIALCMALALCACGHQNHTESELASRAEASVEYIGIYSGKESESADALRTDTSRTRIESEPKTGLAAFEYEVVAGDACIFDYHDKEVGAIVVPEKLDGLTVSCIEERAMEELAAETIELPDTITTIEDMAFAQCRNLKRIRVGAGVQTIGADVFDGCDSIAVETPDDSTMARYCDDYGIYHAPEVHLGVEE